MTQLTNEYFDVKKAGQLVYYFLHKASLCERNITKLRMAKWLYLAERFSYKEFGVPMIGDRLCAMRHGPATSELVAIIEGNSRIFDKNSFEKIIYVSRKGNHQYLELAKECLYSSIDELDRFSDAEVDLLESIWKEYGHWSAVKLENHLHDTKHFPEWNWQEGDGTNWIDLEKILSVVGFNAEDIGPMVENILSFGVVEVASSSIQ
jgi:uncharacterized phage-associated protein